MSKDKVEELFRKFEKLSFEKNVIGESGAHWYYVAYIVITLGAFILLGGAWLYPYVWIKSLMIILFIIGLCLRISVSIQCQKCLKNSADFSVEFSTAFRSGNTFTRLQIFRFRYSPNYEDYVYRKIRDDVIVIDALANEKIEDFISYLEKEGSKKKLRNWLPVTLLAATTFPIWDGFVSYRYSIIKDKNLLEGISLFIELIPWVIYLFFLIWFIAYEFEKLLLSEVKNREKLIKILRLIKING
jgi:hypothetical protein